MCAYPVALRSILKLCIYDKLRKIFWSIKLHEQNKERNKQDSNKR